MVMFSQPNSGSGLYKVNKDGILWSTNSDALRTNQSDNVTNYNMTMLTYVGIFNNDIYCIGTVGSEPGIYVVKVSSSDGSVLDTSVNIAMPTSADADVGSVLINSGGVMAVASMEGIVFVDLSTLNVIKSHSFVSIDSYYDDRMLHFDSNSSFVDGNDNFWFFTLEGLVVRVDAGLSNINSIALHRDWEELYPNSHNLSYVDYSQFSGASYIRGYRHLKDKYADHKLLLAFAHADRDYLYVPLVVRDAVDSEQYVTFVKLYIATATVEI